MPGRLERRKIGHCRLGDREQRFVREEALVTGDEHVREHQQPLEGIVLDDLARQILEKQLFLFLINAQTEATAKRFHYDSHEQLRVHLANLMAAYYFARRLKTLNGLTPYKYIAKIWTSEPDRFIVDLIHQMPGPNT
jgi:transposase InsO family protein